MKLVEFGELLVLALVAPRMGAWIETNITDEDINKADVAPRMGAWIETFSAVGFDNGRVDSTFLKRSRGNFTLFEILS